MDCDLITKIFSRDLHSQRSETLHNILKAIVNVDNEDLLEAFLADLEVREKTRGDRPDHSSTSILSYAISQASPRCVRVFMRRGISTNSTDCLVRTTEDEVTSSVLLAASLGNVAAMEIILTSHPETVSAVTQTGDSLLHVSATCRDPGAVDCMRLLLQFGINTEERNREGRTAIHEAAAGPSSHSIHPANSVSYRWTPRQCSLPHIPGRSAQRQGQRQSRHSNYQHYGAPGNGGVPDIAGSRYHHGDRRGHYHS